jgi:hypothetical protein
VAGFSTRAAQNFSIRVRLKIKNQSPVENFCSVENIHGLILPEEPGSGSALKIGSRLIRIGF